MLTAGETRIKGNKICSFLRADGFESGTPPFQAELARRYTKIGTDTYVENDRWDGARLQVADYNVDGTLKLSTVVAALKRDGFVPGTAPFRAERKRRYEKAGEDAFFERMLVRGKPRTADNYNADGTVKK